ncbi:MAG: hypothetical protein QJR05_10515, partial [Thermoanaerobacterium sp.]|nr:hypothetical protein [Thermoanaerobacterium sp.]
GRKYGVLPTMQDDVLSIMVWNFEDGMEDDVNDRKIRLTLANVPFKGEYKLIHYRIDKEHSNSYAVWKRMGKPYSPSVEQIRHIREREGLELYGPIENIKMNYNMSFEIDMPMHSVSLLLLVPANGNKPEVPRFIKGVVEEGYNGNPQVFLKWVPSKEKDFLYYKVWRRSENEREYTVISDNTSLNTATYIDMDVEKGKKYYYKIQAINASGMESELSEELMVEI